MQSIKDTIEDFLPGIVVIVIITFLVMLVAVGLSGPHHHRHVKTKIEKVKGGRYALKDKKGTWWWYSAKRVANALADSADSFDIYPDSSYAQPWASSSGSVRLPMGGTWTQGKPPLQEEIEEEIEVSVEIDTLGAPEADTDAGVDSDSSGDVGDAGGDGGGGDSGSDGGGDGGGE